MSLRSLHTLACGVFVLGTGAAYVVAAAPNGRRGLLYICLHGALTAAMLLAWWAAERMPAATQGFAFRSTLLAGLVARVLLIPVAAFTSTDIIRYLWDGWVALLGLDPHEAAPNTVRAVLGGWPLPAVHRDLPTLYPPGAIGLFALAASFGPVGAWWAWKTIVATASVVTLLLMASVLRSTAPGRLAIVALSPLLVLEGGIGAHVDVVAALAVAAAIVFQQRGRMAWSTAALAAGACIKPLVAFPLLSSVLGASSPVAVATAAGAVLAMTGVAAKLAGWSLVGSLPTLAAHWRFGSPLFTLIATLGDGLAWSTGVTVAAVMLGVAIGATRDGRWVSGRLWATAAPLVAGPVVFPWYLTPLIPLVAVAPSAIVVAWTASVPLTYEVIDLGDTSGRWEPATWPLVAIVLSWMAGALWCRRAR